MALDDPFVLAGKTYRSRLITGSGKYRSFEETRRATDAAGAEIITVAVRRVNITDPGKENLLDHLPLDKFTILPNTAGCYTADDAVRTCRLAREAGVGTLVKLEVIGDEKTLFPDVTATIEAAKILVKDYQVLPYVTDDPVACKKLEDIGCSAVMPLAAPIGSGLGIRNPYNLRIIIEQSRVPVIVDAGVGTASHAARRWSSAATRSMNTAIAGAKDPIRWRRRCAAVGPAGKRSSPADSGKLYATASSPLDGLIRY
jgi:thiazole synthase